MSGADSNEVHTNLTLFCTGGWAPEPWPSQRDCGQPLFPNAQVQSQTGPWGIWGGQSGSGTYLSPSSSSVSPTSIIPLNPTHIRPSSTLYSLANWQNHQSATRRRKKPRFLICPQSAVGHKLNSRLLKVYLQVGNINFYRWSFYGHFNNILQVAISFSASYSESFSHSTLLNIRM